jgi:hypothetical protein
MMREGRPEVSGQWATMQASKMFLPACLTQVRRRIPCRSARVYFRIPVSLMNATQRFTSDS